MPSNQSSAGAPGASLPGAGPPTKWTQDSTHANSTEYQRDLRQELQRYVKHADRHTLKLLSKFVRSLDK